MKKVYLDASSPLMREFFGYMETVKGKSPLTVDEYFIDLRTFFRYLKQKRNLVSANVKFNNITVDDVDVELCKTVTTGDIFEYMGFLASVRKNNNATRSRKCSSLRAFFGYLCEKKQYIAVNPATQLDNPKLRSSLPRFLTLEQSIELLSAVDGKFKERDYCILTLFLNCGMRLSELVGINFSDILDDNRLRLRGKGNKERIVYLNQACVNAIADYLAVRPRDGVKTTNALFLSNRRQRISPKTVQWLVKKYLGDINLNERGYSVHKLRHTAATLMYQHGDVDIRVLKDILGHENLGTTQIYTHISDKSMEDAAKSNPLSRVRKKKSKPESS